ncbi:MAG: hypothetical protein KF852_00215 [Saprospiraceae bacterium]|nr:hypothetical protein [Saprospiraceae bacterium]
MNNRIFTLLLLVSVVLTFALSGSAQNNCQNQQCLTEQLNISTGVNHATGSLYTPGSGDAYWNLISVPISAGAITVPRPAFVIPRYPAWTSATPNSGWISGQPINNWSVNGGPYTFERCFCVCTPGEYVINLNVVVDDRVELKLFSGSTEIADLGTVLGHTSVTNVPPTTIFLDEGTYCIRAGLFNVGSVAMGLNIQGSVSGPGLLSTFCCNTESAITGQKYNDLNGNGMRDPGEPVLPGWEIQLTDGVNTFTSTTGPDGYYSFTGIIPGLYTLSEVLQPGWTPTLPTAGIVANLDVSPNQVLVINFGNIERENCQDQFDVSFTPLRIIDSENCCYSINYANSGSEAVHALVIRALDGVTIHYNNLNAGYTEQHTPTSITVVPTTLGPFPASVTNLLELCLGHVAAMPQFVVIDYQDENYETFCSDTLRFACMPEEPCLYILSDSLVCDTAGYKYTAVVKNPIGGDFPVGLIKFTINPPLPAGVTFNPEPRFVIDPPLQPGQSTTVMFTIETGGLDLFGDSLCFVLSAHDNELERLCCAEIDTCIAFPMCDPCVMVDVEILPAPNTPRDSCCYELFITNQYPQTGVLTNIQTTILTPGASFNTISYSFGSGYLGIDQSGGGKTDYLWSHTSGLIPSVTDYNLFDFCLKGVTTTDSVYIAINWLAGDSIVCTDTIGVFCPECLEINGSVVECLDDGSYVYTMFSIVNHSSFSVNAIGLVETNPIDTILNAGVYPVPLTPPGGTINVPIHVWLAAGLTEACFDIVLRFVDEATGVNFVCCYATHCIELPDCEQLEEFACPDPEQTSTDPCPTVLDPVCGCDGEEYANPCEARNAGVLVYSHDLENCTGVIVAPGEEPIQLEAEEQPNGSVNLVWNAPPDEMFFHFFVMRHTSGREDEMIGIVTAAGMQSQLKFLDVSPYNGVNEYRIVGVTVKGRPVRSNEDAVYVQWDHSRTVNVTVFPVPTQNLLYVASSKQGPGVVEILGADGRLHLATSVTFSGMPAPIDVSTLQDGVFFVRLRYADGETGQGRMVKMQ